jgi:hypothetical protein
MGDGGSNSVDGAKMIARRLSLANSTQPPAAADLLDPEAVQARQRAAQKMREGLNSSFGTRDGKGDISLRGTEAPPPEPAPVSNKTPRDFQDDPIIPPADREVPQTQEERDRRRREDLARRGKIPDNGGII